ncbi:MAG TPA: 16S rRNA (cytosine(967)-C(5))-methyltransferase RsmB [Steroidobacteraceae bacterium]
MNAQPAGFAAAVLACAARAVAAVAFEGRSSEAAFERAAPGGALSPALRPAVRAVTLGSLRWYLQLEPLVARLLRGRSLAPVLRALLVAALHQLERSRNPIEVTVSSAVDATRALRQPRAAGMVNALLRRFLRERATLLAQVLQDGEAASAHPTWMLSALQDSFPEQCQRIIDADNAHPPMALRLDLSRTTSEDYIKALQQRGLSAHAVPWLATAVVLDAPVAVGELPGFDEGLVSVQDAGAQLAGVLLAPRAGERVLDACAAPGGKSGALLEAADGPIELTAVDIDGARVELIAQNLKRLRREARLVSADLGSDLSWWDGLGYDRILLDAPCSSLGVIRRHPDIKLLRRPGDIAALAAAQRRLLDRCLELLKPDGRLLYCTCSWLPAENEQVVEAILGANPRARLLGLEASLPTPAPWQERSVGVQLLPGAKADTDGFYYACLTVT